MEGLRNSIILGVGLYTLRYAPALFFIGVIVAIMETITDRHTFEIVEEVPAVLFTSRDKAHEALDSIIESSGGLTDCQIEALRQLIDGGFLEAIDNCTLKLHN